MKNYAIILAAGIGSRLYPMTEKYPKSLVKVNGREIVDYQLQGYIKAGIKEEDISIVTGYRTSQFSEYLLNNYPKVNIIENKDYLSTNNMYSLYLGLKFIKENKPDFDHLFINNADCLYDEDMMFEFVNCEYNSAIASELDTFIDESMKIVVDDNKRIVDIAKTITKDRAYAVSIDLYKYSKIAVDELYKIVYDFIEIKKDLKQWTEVAFPHLFKKTEVYPFDIKHKKWVEVDNNDDLALADKLFSNFNLKNKKALILDMDGTIYLGSKPIEGAVDFIKNNKDLDIFYLTNNTSKLPEDYLEKLNSFGIKTKNENILTPLYPLIEYLKNKNYKSVYLVANKKIENYLKDKLKNIDFSYSLENNEAVVLTYDNEITYEKLKNMCVLLNNKKIDYIATHKDIFCPSENGNIPDIGGYIKLIDLTVNKTPDVVLGKPDVKIIDSIIKKYNKNSVAIAGDRLYTDRILALSAECDFICVLSGETKRIDLQEYKNKFPEIVVDNLGTL